MDAKFNTLVEKYIKLRDLKAQREAEHKKTMAPITDLMEQIEGRLMQQFNELGVDSVKTDAGTAFRSTRRNYNVADWDSFLEFVTAGEQWQFIERRANKTAVNEFVEATGDLPPGLNSHTEFTINVRRS